MRVETGYSVIDNGKGIALLFPYPGPIAEACATADGLAIELRLEAPGHVVELRALPAPVMSALRGDGVLLVGVNALSQSTYEGRLSIQESN